MKVGTHTMNSIIPKFTRADYMANRCTHRQYYGQFVSPAIKAVILRQIGRPVLMASKDGHLNDIPLAQWDAMSSNNKSLLAIPNELDSGFSDSNGQRIYSLGGGVCILKEAARQMIEGANP